MQLTVLNVAYSLAPVSTDSVGGAEQILNRIDHALVAAGNNSIVVACEGSRTAGTLVPFPIAGRYDDPKAEYRTKVQKAIDDALRSNDVDLIHLHGLDADLWELPPHIPIVITLHLPVAWYSAGFWQKYSTRAHFCFVSESQCRSCTFDLPSSSVVENGVPIPLHDAQISKGDFALVMGRICPEKNAHAALEAGTLAGIRVLVGGEVFPYREHREYFLNQIQPRLTVKQASDPRHVFMGPLSHERAKQLLARARCLLHPTLAPETSSLVAMEALAVGTPVIAYRSGALPEIVEENRTGFLVDTVHEMAEALHRVHNLSPLACCQAARERFSMHRMITGYFNLYSKLAAGKLKEDLCLAA